MSVIPLAFPSLALLVRASIADHEPVDTPDLAGIAPYAEDAGLGDRAWRRVPGPATAAGTANWFRGELGGLALAVEEEDRISLHLFARDGTPLALRRMTAAWARTGA